MLREFKLRDACCERRAAPIQQAEMALARDTGVNVQIAGPH